MHTVATNCHRKYTTIPGFFSLAQSLTSLPFHMGVRHTRIAWALASAWALAPAWAPAVALALAAACKITLVRAHHKQNRSAAREHQPAWPSNTGEDREEGGE